MKFFVEFLLLPIQEVKGLRLTVTVCHQNQLKQSWAIKLEKSDQRIQNNPLNQTTAFMKLLFGPGYGSRHVKRPLAPSANVILSSALQGRSYDISRDTQSFTN